MSTMNKIIEDASRLAPGALGVAEDAKTEVENSIKGFVDKQFSERGYVTREEFDAVAEMAKNARREIDALKKQIEELKK